MHDHLGHGKVGGLRRANRGRMPDRRPAARRAESVFRIDIQCLAGKSRATPVSTPGLQTTLKRRAFRPITPPQAGMAAHTGGAPARMRGEFHGGTAWHRFQSSATSRRQNAQSNLQLTNTGLNKALSAAVERLPHQPVGRRRGRPRGGEHVPQRHGDPEPGHPQRQRRPVRAADQGQRAGQHRDRARPDGDAGDPGGLGRRRGATSPSCRPSSTR